MRHWKSAVLATILLGGLGASASAQQFGVANGFAVNNGFGGGFNNFGGFNNGFNSGFSNFGYGNLGYTNFGINNFNTNYPQTYNNMGGLIGTIRTQTGRGNSYRYGYGPAVGGRRR